MIKKNTLLFICILQLSIFAIAQPDRWQQKIKYTIDVKMDVLTNKLAGIQKMEYTNNSPDTLGKLFLHLYWNAFMPNSSMDVRSRELGKTQISQPTKKSDGLDWDARVKDRISKLQPNEIGYNRVKSLKINGKEQKLIEHETILEVVLDKAILPKSKTIIDVVFEAQVPLQIRRSGRDNAEGIRYSMSQWYPKMVEYDYQGWNANQYIAREFYGVWGDFDVKINIDKDYMVAASGVLQNPNTIGMGYSEPGLKVRNSAPTLTYNFIANNVHDFVWAADQGYAHLSKQVRKDLTLHVFYKAKDAHVDSSWQGVLWAAEKVLPFIEKKYGRYPYPQYSFIQGGDGGMEYAMATLIKGPSLGTVFHEWMHSWYQQMLGTNESLFGWMDEGFTSFAENEVTDYYQKNWDFINPNQSILSRDLEKKRRDSIDALNKLPAIQADDYAGYFKLAKSPHEEPMTTHADHYNTNYGYSSAVYAKGCVFISQLGYLVGDSVRNKILMEYYNQWRFKHPNANDFIRVAEKVSGLTLQWYKEYWVYSTKTIDYALGSTDTDADGKTMITLKRIGKMPMPLDVLITYKDGSKEMHYIPLNLMLGNKAPEDATPRIIHEEWKWTHPEYQFTTNRKVGEIKSIEIDPTKRMADMNAVNNKLEVPN
jgi:Peptidase family M1 domain